MPVHPDLLRPFTGDRTMTYSRRNKPRITPYHFSDLTAYALAFYYQEVSDELRRHTTSSLYAKDVKVLHYRDTEKQVLCPAPHTVYQKVVLINKDIELLFEQFSYPNNKYETKKYGYARWSAIMATVLSCHGEIPIHCLPDFETMHVTMPAQVGQWLIRNRTVRSKNIFPMLKEIFMPTRVLSPYQKTWEACIQGAIINQMM